jgi:ATP-dependent helicase/nuclease subunit A
VRPPRPLAPSAAIEDELPYAPPSAERWAAAARGVALHALFERLPPVAPADRALAAELWLGRQSGFEDSAHRRTVIDQALAVIDDPRFAALFGEASLAEAPIAATIGPVVIAGTIDRMVIEDDRVLAVDFKTGLFVPPTADKIPQSHIRQMAAYAAALETIFPDRRVEVGLLYTAGPALIMLDPESLAEHKPGLESEKEVLSDAT